MSYISAAPTIERYVFPREYEERGFSVIAANAASASNSYTAPNCYALQRAQNKELKAILLRASAIIENYRRSKPYRSLIDYLTTNLTAPIRADLFEEIILCLVISDHWTMVSEVDGKETIFIKYQGQEQDDITNRSKIQDLLLDNSDKILQNSERYGFICLV